MQCPIWAPSAAGAVSGVTTGRCYTNDRRGERGARRIPVEVRAFAPLGEDLSRNRLRITRAAGITASELGFRGVSFAGTRTRLAGRDRDQAHAFSERTVAQLVEALGV